jgi:hypothetical protein
MDDDPVDGPRLSDRLAAYMAEHPECDLDDAMFALIWGEEEEDDAE